MAIHVWACFQMKCQLWDTTNFMEYQENFNTERLSMFSIVPEMFVNSDTLHFSQTNVWQSHVCFKLLQRLAFKKYIKIIAKPCKNVHVKLDHSTFINFQVK